MSGEDSGERPGPQLIRRPLVYAATTFTLGVLMAGRAVNLPGNIALAAGGLVLAAAMGARRRILSLLVLLVAFWAVGVVVGQRRLPRSLDSEGGAPLATLTGVRAVFEGRVVEAPEHRPDATRLVMELAGTSTAPGMPMSPLAGRALVQLPATSTRTPSGCGEPGDRIRVLGRAAAFDDQTFPGGISPSAWAARRGVNLRIFGNALDHCVRLEVGSRERGLRASIEKLRARMQSIVRAALPREQAGIVAALATGDRSGIDRTTRDAFARAGIAHLLAISGLHLAIVTGLITGLFLLILGRSERVLLGVGARRAAALGALPFVPLYALLAGASPSTVRASIMVVALLLAYAMRRLTDAWSSLALAVIVMLAWDPATLGDVSFQLSFAAVAGLLRIQPALKRALFPRIASWPRLGRYPVEVFLASVAATIGTAPLVARHFHQTSLVGLLVNIVAVPLTSVFAVPLSLAGALLGVVSAGVGGPVLAAAGGCAELLLGLAHSAAALPGAWVATPTPTILECVLFYGATIGFSSTTRRRGGRWLGFSSLALLVVLVGASEVNRIRRDDLRMTFLPVGQGDAIVGELPTGKVLLVDTGPAYEAWDAGERVVLPFLRTRRLHHIDLLVITHPHADHSGGLASIARQMSISEVWWNGDRREAPDAFLETLEALERTTVIRVVSASTAPARFGDLELEVLGPGPAPESSKTVNDASIVLRLGVPHGRAILLTGDLEADGERTLLERCAGCLRADVLKAGHHGSRSSSTEAFLEAVGPTHVIITAGRHNHFGFPHREMLDRLMPSTEVWRTDRHGAVTVELGATGDVTVSPYLQPAEGPGR